jgi:hypothetical protein
MAPATAIEVDNNNLLTVVSFSTQGNCMTMSELADHQHLHSMRFFPEMLQSTPAYNNVYIIARKAGCKMQGPLQT